MKRKSTPFFVRTTMMLLLMLLTSISAWADDIDLGDYSNSEITLKNGDNVFGDLYSAKNVQVFIADGATVTLSGVNINQENYAGITCLGNATIILSGENTITGGYGYPGIQAAKREGEGDEYTLTIQGDGSLTANGSTYAAGIGGGEQGSCGNITMSGGTVTATGSEAGIGSGFSGSCGDITISGGTVIVTGGVSAPGIGCGYGYEPSQCGNITISGGTVIATGGVEAPGIGCGGGQSKCGDITITPGITSVTATKGDGAPYSIGKSASGEATCGTVTINGVVGPVSASPITLAGLAVDGDIAEDTAGHYYVNMPKTGTNTLMLSDATVGTIKVYDDGGKSAPFSSSCEGTLVITAPVGYVINIEGEVTTKSSSYDFLYIFDSNEADFSKQLGSMAGDTDQGYANIDCISSTGNYMTLYFESSTEDNDAAGLDFTVTLTQKKNFTLCTATLPDQSLDGYSNMYYKFDAANYGYVTIGETVKDGETVLTLGTDYTFGSVTFADMTGHDENDAPSAVGDVWRVPIIGMGDYAGTKYVDFTIVNPNGTWGDLTWSLADDGTLSITGTGAMKTADTYGKYPWNNYCSSVTAITIGEGITSIAPYAFGGQNYIDIYSNVKTVTLPSTLTSIGDEAFRGCTGSDFKSVVIPAGVTSIGGNAFYGCTGVANVYCYADPTKLTWEDTGDDFIVDNTNPKQTKCHVADASAWSGFSGVNVTFVGDLATTSIPYIDANGNTQYCTDFTVLTNSTDVSNLPGGWYVVKGDVNYTSTVTFTGSATLILANGCTMNVGTSESPINAHGISVTGNGNDLIIYGQSLDEATAGHLNVYVNSEHDDGINVDDAYVQHSGIVNIVSYDCGIVAEGKFDTMSHPIDGTGTVTINGGKITATSSKNYGIYAGSLVTISGGNVSASGDQHGIYTYGNIILGWTNPTDRIYASIYCAHGNVSIANGKAMTDGTKAYTSATPSATLEELENKTLQPITGVSVTKDGSGNLTATLDPSSEEEINIPVAIEVDHVTVNRTYENGKASTVYLPFTIAYDKVTGGTFNTFTSVDEGATPWTVTYTEVTSGNIEANTPYIFLPDGTNSGKIVVDNGTDQVSVCTGNPQTTKQGLWEFIGTYKRIKWTHDTTDQEYNAEREAEIGQVYGFAANDSGTDHVGDFVKVGNDVWINPGRAYLKRTPAAGARALTPDDETQQLPEVMKVVIVSADGTTTEIGTLNTRTGEITTDEWYSLDGQRLNGKPTKKGIYIHNGIKVVIK